MKYNKTPYEIYGWSMKNAGSEGNCWFTNIMVSLSHCMCLKSISNACGYKWMWQSRTFTITTIITSFLRVSRIQIILSAWHTVHWTSRFEKNRIRQQRLLATAHYRSYFREPAINFHFGKIHLNSAIQTLVANVANHNTPEVHWLGNGLRLWL